MPLDGTTETDLTPEGVPPMEMYALPGDAWGDRWAEICQQWQTQCDRVLEQATLTPEKIRAALDHKDPTVLAVAVEEIGRLPEDEQQNFIRKFLDHKDPTVLAAAVRQIYLLPKEEWLGAISTALRDPDPTVLAAAVGKIWRLPKNEWPEAVMKALKDEDPTVRAAAVPEIWLLPKNEQRKLFPNAFEGGVLHPLRLAQAAAGMVEGATEGRRRIPFAKTGSALTVLDGQGMGDMVIHGDIPASALAAWKAAYAAHDFWQNRGFDYVPVAPIVRAWPQADGINVRVASRILGPQVRAYLAQAKPPFAQEIRQQMTVIQEGLRQLGIKHGHSHDGNFCLVFPHDAQGAPDYNQKPRVYVIDFDAAVITNPPAAGAAMPMAA